MVVLPWIRPPNAGSMVRMSGSWKYTDGAVKSRGGLVVVVGGVAGPAPPGGGAGWAMTAVGAMAAAPTTAATDLMIVRRDSMPPETDVPVGMSTSDSLRSLWVARVTPCPIHDEDGQASKPLKTFSTGDVQFRR